MALTVTHTTVAVNGDHPTDPTILGQTAWNEAHTITGFGTGVETALAVNVGTAGAPVVLNGAGGTPSSITLTNGTGLPLTGLVSDTTTALGVGSINLGHATDTTLTRVSAGVVAIEGSDILTAATGQPLDSDLTSWAGVTRASGFDTFAATPSSTNLKSLVSDETGSGALVFANTPTLVTPVLGVATATSINKMAVTAPATSSTLAVADGKTFTVSNTLTFTGTDTSSVAFGAGGTAAYTGNKLSAFAATTSSELAGVISDETGSGALVFANTPTLVTPALGVATATTINKVTLTAPATGSTLTIPDGVTLTGPASSGTAATLGNAETFTATKTFNAATQSVILGANGGNAGSAKFFGSTSGDVTVKAAAAAGTATIFQLPATNGTNAYVLQTDGTGVTSWVAQSGGGGTNLGAVVAVATFQAMAFQ